MESLRVCSDYFLGPSSLPSDEREALKVACREFEAIFVHMLLREMRKTIPQSNLIPESRAMEIYKDMFDLALSKEIAKRELFGIARMLYKEYERNLR
ncbi:MAG: rod-binding protein [Synergistetes bacterium]|nr:rod-binding protein [Synergistota bacterium]